MTKIVLGIATIIAVALGNTDAAIGLSTLLVVVGIGQEYTIGQMRREHAAKAEGVS